MSEIRELAMRLLDAVSPTEHVHMLRNNQCLIERDELEAIVRAAMREAYIVAITTCRHEAAKESTQRLGLVATGTAYDCANAIRAEADKLEGK